MTFQPRATATSLLVLVALGSAACDLERWLRMLSSDSPARLEVAEGESAQDARGFRADPDLDRPLRAPDPPASSRSSFNKISSSSSTPAKKPASSASRAAARAPREIRPGSAACENARSGVARMEAHVASMEREVERLSDDANDIRQSDTWRTRQESRMEAAERQLEQAEDALGDYLDSQRRQGVPAGCLR
jgi:hypothetical protein